MVKHNTNLQLHKTKRSIDRSFEHISKFLDPFLVVGILILFAVPVLTVLNLTPTFITQRDQPEVLGVKDAELVEIVPYMNTKDGITVEKMQQKADAAYTLYINDMSHTKGTFKNQIFTATNHTQDEKKIQITPTVEGAANGTKVSVVVDGVKFVILDENGTTYPPTLYISSGDATTVYLQVDSNMNVNYAMGLALELVVE